ncbi:MAG TPA: OmpH family outer membrane protein [Candidatus Anaerobiospirillum pullistercoris]|uniref:OmpH family outer membrane protein n=1 Tax=Candidatus Anaerobiospirillum pullistercoris TaxID=2838452 RepID=A0A9D2B0C0_9GAMM|nr:OmpH family outer membrane protein [Candidatus Anaerobiospirillum pullistercoris]
MLKKVLLASALGAALFTTSLAQSAVAAEAAAAKAPTIAVLNLQYIMTEIPQSKALQQTLAKEFGAREQELQKMQQEGVKLSQDLAAGKYKGDELTNKRRELEQLQADFRLKGRALQEDQQKRVQEEEREVMVTVQRAIDSIAQERGIDLVLRGEAIAYTISDLDISQEVIKRVSADKGSKK